MKKKSKRKNNKNTKYVEILLDFSDSKVDVLIDAESINDPKVEVTPLQEMEYNEKWKKYCEDKGLGYRYNEWPTCRKWFIEGLRYA